MQAEQGAREGSDRQQRLAAAAALALIEGAGIVDADDTGRIFKTHPDSIPVKDGHFDHHGLLVQAACRLAEKVGLNQSAPSPDKARGLAARSHLRELLGVSVVNLERRQPADQWWNESFEAITQMLDRYDAPASAYPSLSLYGSHPELDATTPDPPVTVARQPEESADPPMVGDSRPRPQPERGTGTRDAGSARSAQRSQAGACLVGTRGRVAGLVAVLTVVSCIVVAEVVAPIPRFLFGWQDTYVDSYPLPLLSPPVEGVDSALTLPNTSVRLFFMSQGSEQSPADQTVNGQLPVAAAAVMPLEYQVATFQVLLSRKRPDLEADTKLKLWIQVPTPMKVVGATLMKDPAREGIPQPDLNSDNENGGTAVKVPSLDEGNVLYQFQVVARPDTTNNGYLCGYNAKFVQVMVRSEAKTATSQDGVVTPYPLYVPRGEGC